MGHALPTSAQVGHDREQNPSTSAPLGVWAACRSTADKQPAITPGPSLVFADRGLLMQGELLEPSIRVTRDRYAWLSLLILLASLPLQWQTVRATTIGYVRPFTLAAIVLLVVAAKWVGSAAALRYRRSATTAIVATGSLLLLTTSFSLFRGAGMGRGAQQLLYATTGLTAGALVFLATTRKTQLPRWLVWAGPASVAMFLLAFANSARSAGVNLAATVTNAIATGDPSRINFALFRAVFASEPNGAARANLRHEIMAALVVVTLYSIWANAILRPRRWIRSTNLVSGAVAALIVLLSLSRSSLLGLVLAALPWLSRPLLRGSARSNEAIAVAVALSAVVVGLFTPVATVLGKAVADTASYEARSAQIPVVLERIARSPIVGSMQADTELSPHNLPLQAFADAGVLAFLASIALLATIFGSALSLFRIYMRTGNAVAGVGVSAAAMPLVRAFTAGSGTFHVVEWLSVGLLLGLRCALGGRAARSRGRAASGVR